MKWRVGFFSVLVVAPVVGFAQVEFNTTGFTTDYSNGNIDDYQTYELFPAGTIANNYNGAWTTSALTLPGGAEPNFMLVNGGSNTANLWTESLNVTGTGETFDYYATSVYSGDTANSGSAAVLQLYVDGSAVGSAQQIVFNTATPGQFVEHSIALGSLTSGSHTFKLVDTDGASGGNDFALAAPPTPAPEPFTMAVGLAGIGMFVRRKLVK